ncbi:prolyl oligopeptidase family serine peptidase [Asticcacaulis solisilvae]|uniref:prolyl oligopeptidase family serine peptidase n=1 Tax=Asticcacaulis solisilvae TaxID=1217274 RepID=UPI003FD870FF
MLASAGMTAAGVQAAAPVAKRVPVTDTVYGTTISDPYRWMEGPNNAAFAAWLKAQGQEGRARLNASPSLNQWQQRLNGASSASVTNRLQHRINGRIFFLRLDAGKQGALMVRMTDGKEKVLFDPNTVGGAHASITNYGVSPDGRTVAVNVDRGGNEITTVEFYNVDTGQKLPDELTDIWGEFVVAWQGNDGVFYTQMAPDDGKTDRMLNMRTRYHKLGQSAGQDPTVIPAGGASGFALAPEEFPFIATDASSPYAMVVASGARAEARICVARAADLTAPGAKIQCPIAYDDEVQAGALVGSTLYLQSAKNAPNGQVLAMNLDAPTLKLSDAKVVVAEDREAVVTNFAPAHDALYVKRMRLGIDSFVRLPYSGKAEFISAPYDGQAALIDATTDADGLIFTLQGWTKPRALYSYDPARRALTDLKLGATSLRDYSGLVDSETAQARSLDGTMVPVTILKPKGYKPNGHAKAIVFAYGAYGATTTQPAFDVMSLEWVADGNLYVLAGIRGGGEKGDAWRLAGKGANKARGVEDIVAAADLLRQRGYSDKKHIVLYSASAGGIIVGNAVDRFPDHFGAAIIHAGMLNPTRLAADSNGANQYSEFGDPNVPQGFKDLKAMDAYLNLKPGQRYPDVMLDVGLNDNRVAPWNSGKYGAQLKYYAKGQSLVLFRTDADAGHFGTSLSQAAAEAADHYAFVDMVTAAPAAKAPAVKRHRRSKRH